MKQTFTKIRGQIIRRVDALVVTFRWKLADFFLWLAGFFERLSSSVLPPFAPLSAEEQKQAVIDYLDRCEKDLEDMSGIPAIYLSQNDARMATGEAVRLNKS